MLWLWLWLLLLGWSGLVASRLGGGPGAGWWSGRRGRRRLGGVSRVWFGGVGKSRWRMDEARESLGKAWGQLHSTADLLYEGAAERMERTEAVSKSSGPKDSIAARANRGTSSSIEVAIWARVM